MTLPADWLEYIQKVQREQKKAPGPLKSHQRPVKGMESKRMQQIRRQTPNMTKAAFGLEPEHSQVPTMPNSWRGTLNLGGTTDSKNAAPTGKSTKTRTPGKK